jgi:hypothetical protein
MIRKNLKVAQSRQKSYVDKIRRDLSFKISDALEHTLEVCKGTHLYNRYPAIKDDCDSWGMCTTSAECKTVITVVLTVISGMDPHIISGNLGWVFVKS